MEIAGLLIGIIGIIIAFLYIPPVVRFRKRLMGRLIHWAPRLQARKENIQTSFSGRPLEIAYEYYSHHIDVDSAGNATHTIEAKVVNTSDHLVPDINYCIYADARSVDKESIAPWFEVGDRKVPASFREWDPQSCSGVVTLRLEKPITPGSEFSFRWGYYMQRTFTTGDEYYNFDFGAKHSIVEISIRFSPVWSIHYARWDSARSTIVPPPPKVSKNIICASLKFPDFKSRERLLMGLSRAKS